MALVDRVEISPKKVVHGPKNGNSLCSMTKLAIDDRLKDWSAQCVSVGLQISYIVVIYRSYSRFIFVFAQRIIEHLLDLCLMRAGSSQGASIGPSSASSSCSSTDFCLGHPVVPWLLRFWSREMR